jgi:class 3 adenylate cyclase
MAYPQHRKGIGVQALRAHDQKQTGSRSVGRRTLGQTERRLSAIMLADTAGYSTLMEREESRTFARLQSLREQVVNPEVAEFGGRVIKTTGDGFSRSFPALPPPLDAALQFSE